MSIFIFLYFNLSFLFIIIEKVSFLLIFKYCLLVIIWLFYINEFVLKIKLRNCFRKTIWFNIELVFLSKNSLSSWSRYLLFFDLMNSRCHLLLYTLEILNLKMHSSRSLSLKIVIMPRRPFDLLYNRYVSLFTGRFFLSKIQILIKITACWIKASGFSPWRLNYIFVIQNQCSFQRCWWKLKSQHFGCKFTMILLLSKLQFHRIKSFLWLLKIISLILPMRCSLMREPSIDLINLWFLKFVKWNTLLRLFNFVELILFLTSMNILNWVLILRHSLLLLSQLRFWST